MSLRPDQKALVFVGAIAVLGATVRVMRAATGVRAVSAQPALEHQLAAADSARAQQEGGRGGSKGRGRRGRGGSLPTLRRSRADSKLDLDVATAAQIDSLPGVTPTLAKRIVADRMMRGPFLSKDGLRRVSGLGPSLIETLDSLVTFSGTLAPTSPADTVIPSRRKKSRSKPPTPPVVLRRSARPRAPSLRAAADSCWLVPELSALRRHAT